MKYFLQGVCILASLAGLLPPAAQGVAVEPGGAVAAAPMGPAEAGRPRVSIQFRLVTQQPRTGEPVEFEVKFEAPPAVTWQTPTFGRELGKWVVMSHRPGPYAMQAGYQIRKDRVWLLTYATGQVDIPALGVKFRLPDKREGMAPSQALSVMLAPARGKASGPQDYLRDLKNPVGFFPWLQAILALALVSVVLGGIYGYARRTGLIQAKPAEPPRPPAEVARERLAALRASGLWGAGQYKAYYSELTDIMRRYLEGRFAIAALDQTTPELMRNLKAKQFLRQDVAVLRELLERADLAKFAKTKPVEQEALSDWRAVAEWVERTAPAQPQATGGAAPENPGGAQTHEIR